MELELLEHCASDLAVVNAARVSFAKSHEQMEEGDEKLIEYLLKNRHGTPFEHGYFRFHVEAPIFVLREWQRHRVGHSYNEMSGRYVELEKRFYEPAEFRRQVGKPGAYAYEVMASDDADKLMACGYFWGWASYDALLKAGVAKEQARAVLPLGTYSQMHWSCNPRSLMHFLSLRNAPAALKEIRDLARDAEAQFELIMPVTYGAFVRNGRVAP